VVEIDGKEFDVEAKSVIAAPHHRAVSSAGYSAQKSNSPMPVAAPPQPSPNVAPPPSAPILGSSDRSTVEGDSAILAPMPGVVLEVLVSVGQGVKPGDVVMRIEAMKMENDIKSHAEGKVKELLVKKGQDVQERDVLLVLEG